MAVNFRLSYNTGINYVDLFPSVVMQNITDGENLLKYSTLNVTIPSDNLYVTNNIPLTLTQAQQNAPFFIFLISTGGTAQEDYNCITSAKIESNNLVLSYFYELPTNDIEILLIFLEGGV